MIVRRRRGEFLTVWRQTMQGEHVDFHGKHIDVTGAKVPTLPVQKPYPPLYFGGSSPAGKEVGAKHADVYLLWGEPPAIIEKKISEMKEKAAVQGRQLKFGIRLHVIVRDTELEAWNAAEELIQYVRPYVDSKKGLLNLILQQLKKHKRACIKVQKSEIHLKFLLIFGLVLV